MTKRRSRSAAAGTKAGAARAPATGPAVGAKARPARPREPGPSASAPAEISAAASRSIPAWTAALALALVLLAAFWLQRAALRAPFFADDFLFLDQVRNRSLGAALASADPIGNFVRPIGRQLDFWLLARLGNESPLPFHAANLALFLIALALLFAVARRLAGTAAAVIAAGFVALHYAADVPLLWASGSQDLLALTFALAALALFLAGRRWPAALALLAGMLSKETVLFTPLIAALAARRRGEPWRATFLRAWPLALAPALWAALWLSRAVAHPGVRRALGWSATGLAAAFVHLAQVAPGIEWRAGGALRFLGCLPSAIPTLLVLAAIAVTTWRSPAPSDDRTRAIRPALLGLAWAALGALPIAAVSSVWSAYYYLFALCGLGLALGACLARSRAAAIIVVALLAWGSQNGRRLDEFITVPGVWTRQSHVNRLYVERATSLVGGFLAQLRRAHPTLPHRSTLFFGGLPSFIAFQSGDGPLVRWAYRDSSLRSYYILDFSPERYRRGPAFAFVAQTGTLQEQPLGGPFLRACALGAMLADRPRSALEILDLPEAGESFEALVPYWRAWLQWGLGDTVSARASLIEAGAVPADGPTPEATEAVRVFAAGDTMGGIRMLSEGVRRHELDGRAHAILAAMAQTKPDQRAVAAIEAYAAVVLAPRVPIHWWVLGYSQYFANRTIETERSFERFFALGGGDPDQENAARRILDELHTLGPGGAKFQRSLHEGAR